MNVRLVFLAITAFWIVMNVLLWRRETRGGGSSEVPLQTVAQRVLEAADSSTLQIRQDAGLIGQLRWTPAVLHDDASATNQLVDEGMVTTRAGYAVDFDLNLVAGAGGLNGRGAGRVEFDADLSWRSLDFRFNQKRATYEFFAGGTNAQLSLRVLQANQVVFSQNLPLKDPGTLLTTLDGALGGFGLISPGLLSGLGVFASASGANATPAVLPANLLRWEARTTELRIGQHWVPVYQITARLLDRYEGNAWIGRSGELLRVALPHEIHLSDERLPLLGAPASLPAR